MQPLIRQVPGRKSRSLARRLKCVECPEVTCLSDDFPVFWDRAAGSAVWDVDGNRYVDMTGAFAVSNFGHGHPALVAALNRQSRRLIHGMGDVHPPEIKVRFLERLGRSLPKTPGGWQTILSQNGSDAVESAIKSAMVVRPGRDGIVAFSGAYHGLGFGALSATWRADFRRPFAGRISKKTMFVPYPYCYRCPLKLKYPSCGVACLDEATRRIGAAGGSRRFAAVMVEPVQGRGGEVAPPEGWLKGLADFCRRENLLLIADEIYTGFGRTGKMFGCDHDHVVPDFMCLGKGMTGGFPMSACAGKTRLMRRWGRSTGEAVHTSTFLGDPLGCAMGVTALSLYRKLNPAKRAAKLGAYFLDRLAKSIGGVEAVGDIRGKGLMIGVELVKDRESRRPDSARAGRVVVESLQRGLMIMGGGVHQNVISISPPLTVRPGEIDFCVEVLEDALRASGKLFQGRRT